MCNWFVQQEQIGVDCFDQMARLYSTRSASRWLPLAIRANILDIAAINAGVIFVKSTGNQISRRDFILALIECLSHKRRSKTSIALTPGLKNAGNVMQQAVKMERHLFAPNVKILHVVSVHKMTQKLFL